MRIHLKIDSNGTIVPFNHQDKLTGVINKWIGENNGEHGELSLYSFSNLTNASLADRKKGLLFPNGTSFFISAYDNELIKSIINNIQHDQSMFSGLKVQEITIEQEPDLSECECFFVASPVFIKRKVDDNEIKHYSYKDAEASAFLVETLKSKMNKAGLHDDSLEIYFDTNYPKAKTRIVHYKNVKNKTNICPVIIKAKPETKAFAWNVGVGNSTGIGLGALK